jgi:uncharacterized membrane protein YkvA (DUF1232 family)
MGAQSSEWGREVLARLRGWAAALKRDILALWYCYRDPRTPLVAKLCAMLVVAYALSPIDLIPDFIPVLGYLDELILLPLAIYFTLKLIPAEVLEAGRARAADWSTTPRPKLASYIAAAVIVLIWLALGWLLWFGAVRGLAR